MIEGLQPHAEYKESRRCPSLRKSAQSVDENIGCPQISQMNADLQNGGQP